MITILKKIMGYVGIALVAMFSIIGYGKIKKNQGKNEQILNEKAEAYDATTKDAQHIANHLTDSIDDVIKRMRPYIRPDQK